MDPAAPRPLLSPARPARAACVAWLGALLADDRRAGLVREERGPDGSATTARAIRWNLIAPDYDRALGREAWEAFVQRDLLEPSWLGDARRAFRLRRDEGCGVCNSAGRVAYKDRRGDFRQRACRACDGVGARLGERVLARWDSVRAAMTFASDGANVAAAEALAREAAARLRAWGVPRPGAGNGAVPPVADVIVWRLLGDGEPLALLRRGARILAPLALRALGVTWSVAVARDDGSDALRAVPARGEPASLERARDAWRLRAAEGAAVPAQGVGGGLPSFLPIGVRFADLPCPFEPLCALWELGYALEDVRADGIFLLGSMLDRVDATA